MAIYKEQKTLCDHIAWG